MAYDANGMWQTEDDSVEKRLTGLLAKDSAYMKQGETQGKAAASARGLTNSGMAVRSAQAARIDRALPVASQDAGQTSAKNLSRQGYEQSGLLQKDQLASTEKIAQWDISSREKVAGMEIEAAMNRLREQGVQAQDLQKMRDAAEKERQGISLTSEEKRHADSLKNAMDISNNQIGANTDNVNRQILADDRRAAAGAVGDANTRRSTAVTAIMNNPDIPPDVRDARIQDANNQYSADVNLVEQIYNVDLDYPVPNAPSTQTAPTAAAPEAARAQVF